jgi:nucleoside-diphosphate-sugar epimerase
VSERPVILITGAGGGIGSDLSRRMSGRHRVVGFDLKAPQDRDDDIKCDLTDDASVELALRKLRDRFGGDIAAVIHLAAYFDFSGKEKPGSATTRRRSPPSRTRSRASGNVT